MAVTAKNLVVIFVGIAMLAGVVVVWYATMQRWAAPYQESDATWIIRGRCIDAQNGNPILDARITISFREAVAFKHHWRNAPSPATTDITVQADDDGYFEIKGKGGAVYVTAAAKGYRVLDPWESWSHRAMNRITQVDTNVVLKLTRVE